MPPPTVVAPRAASTNDATASEHGPSNRARDVEKGCEQTEHVACRPHRRGRCTGRIFRKGARRRQTVKKERCLHLHRATQCRHLRRDRVGYTSTWCCRRTQRRGNIRFNRSIVLEGAVRCHCKAIIIVGSSNSGSRKLTLNPYRVCSRGAVDRSCGELQAGQLVFHTGRYDSIAR